ncbi:hypothetical protein [Chryseobacterium wanjuense]
MLDQQNAYIFIYILPFFHQIRGDKKWFERCMTAFLQVPVEVTFSPNVIDGIEENDDSMLLGNSRLGVTYIPSGRHMDGQQKLGGEYLEADSLFGYEKIYRWKSVQKSFTGFI